MKKANSLFLFYVLMLLASTTLGQKRVTIEPTFITIADGLASQSVNDVLQDSYGLIWIGTTNGLQRYDGSKFETFKTAPGKLTSIHSNVVWDVLEDIDHSIWVATEIGVARYDREKNEFKNFTFGAEVGVPVGAGRTFKLFVDSQQRLFATTANTELVRYDRKKGIWAVERYLGINTSVAGFSSTAFDMSEDSNGGLWMGSGSYGLMYRAKSDSSFRRVNTPIDLFDANTITSIYSESPTRLYLTTRSGVYRYNPVANTIATVMNYTTDLSDGNNAWNCIAPDNDGNIWIMNNFRGILKFPPNSDQYEHVFIKGSEIELGGTTYNYGLSKFMIDRSGIFWMGSNNNGLIKYDPANKPFSFYSHSDTDPNTIAPGGVFGILASKVKPGIIYLGTRGSGFQVFDSKAKTFKTIPFKSKAGRFAMYSRSFYEEANGNLWIGGWEDGLLKMDKNYNEIQRYAPDGKPGSISNGQVRVIKEAPNGKLWIGTNFGLNEFDLASGEFKFITSVGSRRYPKEFLDDLSKMIGSQENPGIINNVTAAENKSELIEVKEAGKYLLLFIGEGDGTVMADYGWLENSKKDTLSKTPDFAATYHAGGSGKNRMYAELLELQPGSYTLRYMSDDSHDFSGWNEDPPSFKALSWGVALLKVGSVERINEIQKLVDPNLARPVISGDNISDILVGKKYTWVGTIGEGLNRIDPADNSIKTYRYSHNDENTISSDTPNSFYEENGETLWIATTEGVNKLDIATDKITRYSESEGLPTNFISQIVVGDENEMWLSTQNGISQMLINESLNRVTFINYNSTDGIGGNNFVPLTATRAPDGQYYFGGDHGLTTFSKVNSDTTPPAVLITNLSISNKSVSDMKENSPLKGSLLSAKGIELSFDQDNLSFEFAGLHYANPKKNQLAHKLEGYDKDWIYDNRNFAAYTNLEPGVYIFKVRASNAFGIWNEEGASLKITIHPPWWRTWWAYAAYAGIFGLVAFQGNNAMRRNIKRRERERSREKELAQAKEIEKAYTNLKATQAQLVIAEKMASLGELTAGIAHEIQNPLNFVNNFSEINKELIEEMKTEISSGNIDEAKSIADIISENETKIIYHGKRADGIVKGMLQHSRTSTGQKEATDVNALSDEYLRLAYHGLRAKDKSFNAKMHTDFDANIGKINVIPQDLGRVILNLITNAFYVVAERKAASAPGTYEPTVSVSTKRIGDKVEIRVTDNGKGIPAAIIDKIFQPFFTTKPSGQGTGLGLSLSYEIVTKGHGGELKVETREGEGTTFIIIIPA